MTDTEHPHRPLDWLRVLGPDELPEGRVKPVTCRHLTLCMTHFEGRYAAFENHCPHQGGPLGEGSIESGWLRCPWHGWDYHPLTGESPGGYGDGLEKFPVEVRNDGVYVGLARPKPHTRTSTDVMAETMVAWGVRQVFGMVGHSNLGLADALRRQVEQGRLRYYGIRHEGAGALAASAYGKLTGRPAGCLAIAGPGATNLLTGLWDAHVDRAPVLALTGQVPTQLIGRGAFQEVDLTAAFGGVARWSSVVQSHSHFAELMSLAVKHAIEDAGPTQLVFPDDVQTLEAPDQKAAGPEGRLADVSMRPSEASLRDAIAKIAAAKRPQIIVGYGTRHGMAAVQRLAEKLQCGVATTFKGKGLIGDDHPLGCGVLGRSGTPVASWFMNEADLLIVFGSSFSNHTGITSYKPIVQVDHDRGMLGRFHSVTVPVWGDVETSAEALIAGLDAGAFVDQRAEIADRWKIWRAEKARRPAETGQQGVHSVDIFSTLSQCVDPRAIMCVDVGNNTYSFGRYFETRAQSVLMSGYLGSIGFGFPAAMGAWSATTEKGSEHEGRQVVAITGDGGFGQYMGEYLTAKKYGMNLTHILLNNHELGKISKEQESGQFDVWETSLVNPSFAAYAKLCGLKGTRVDDAKNLGDAIAEALSHDGPAVVEVMADVRLI